MFQPTFRTAYQTISSVNIVTRVLSDIVCEMNIACGLYSIDKWTVVLVIVCVHNFSLCPLNHHLIPS